MFERAKMTPSLEEFSWQAGFWGDRFGQCRREMIFVLEQAFLNPDNGAYLLNFRNCAENNGQAHRGTFWSDGDCYKWLEAVASVYGQTKDAALSAKMDEYIDDIARAQEPDGYICTQIQMSDKERWQDSRHHELYNLGHLFTTSCCHYLNTGKEALLNIAKKACDYLYSVFQLRPLNYFGFNPSQIMGCVDLYRLTGDRKYLELANIFVRMRGAGQVQSARQSSLADAGNIEQDTDLPTDQTQARIPLPSEDEAVGHAVTGTYLWAGASDVLSETGELDLNTALLRLWDNVVSRKLYITGAVGALYNGLSSRHDLVHEAFGYEYQLPNRRAYNETCANIGMAMWAQKMLQIHGEGRFADIIELVMYNSGLSGANLKGTAFFYANPLAKRNRDLWKSGDQVSVVAAAAGSAQHQHEARKRWLVHSCVCCPPQYVRTIARIHEWLTSIAPSALYLHLYSSCQIRLDLPEFGTVKLGVKTDYPWNDKVVLQILEGSGFWKLFTRIPGWCQNWGVKIDGAEIEASAENGYLELERNWKTGDTIELDLDMPPVFMTANPLIEEAGGKLCIQRGPLIYCLESDDLPNDVNLDDIRLIPENPLIPEFRKDLLGGVTVIKTDGKYCQTSWKGLPYQKIDMENYQNIALTLIPYFAWANRSDSEMSVWLPVV